MARWAQQKIIIHSYSPAHPKKISNKSQLKSKLIIYQKTKKQKLEKVKNISLQRF